MLNPKKFVRNIISWSIGRVKLHGDHYTTFGIFGILYYIVTYFVWSHVSDVKFQTLIFRVIACMLCFYLVILHQTKVWWASQHLKEYVLDSTSNKELSESDRKKFINNEINTGFLPIYWLITVCYCLPLMSTYNLCVDSFNITWVVTFALSVLTLVILVDWIVFIGQITFGIIFGYALFYITSDNPVIEYNGENIILVIYIILFSIIIGAFFLYQKESMIYQITQANIELEKLNVNLDKLVLERTKDLNKALEYKTEFLNNISHEIRTPLQGILGVSSSLVDDWNKYSDSQKEQQIKVISESSDNLMALVSNLLDLSKFEAGKMLYEFKEYNIVNLIENAVLQLKPLIIDRDIELTFIKPTNFNSFKAFCDISRIEQVIRNFLSNAIKYSTKGNIEIKISFSNVSGNELAKQNLSHIKVSVKDLGVGVPNNELKEIFYPFAQSSRTSNRSGGTGLGLSLSAEIIAAHKGKIWAENNLKENGVTFYFTIPINHKIKKKSMSNVRNNSITQKNENISKGKVLFVDDEEFCQISGKIILESLGYEVLIADSGKSAISQFSNVKFDLIFLDLMMPDMFGTDLLRIIRENRLNSLTPVILQSGASDDREISKALSLGANNFIIKPYNKNDIYNAIDEL